MGLDYVDIFYSHRPDPDTPLEETMMALDSIVKQEKLYMLVFPIMMQNKQKKPLRS
jgi:aryl-alcohol dehydrogenase-like predicted oxidoreductase